MYNLLYTKLVKIFDICKQIFHYFVNNGQENIVRYGLVP